MEDTIITVATYPYSRAQLLKVMLEAEGIECFLSNINLVQPDIATGVKIRIHQSDLEEALKIIEEVKANYGTKKQKSIDQMKRIRRILVPVDFSEYSINACKYAIGLVTTLKAEIKLYHSYFNPVISVEPYSEASSFQLNLDNVILRLEKDAKLQMNKLIKELQNFALSETESKIKITYVLERGIPEDTILGYANKYKPGVIVIGTKGSDGSKVKFIGRVTKKIIEKANVPVLAIPQDSVYHGIKYVNKLLYATDFDDSEFKAIRKLLTLVRPFGLKIYIIHIASDSENLYDKAKMNSLMDHFAENYAEFNVTFDIISHEDVHQGLEDFIEEKDIDVIALTTRKRGIFERLFNPSVAQMMMYHTHIPLLVFHS